MRSFHFTYLRLVMLLVLGLTAVGQAFASPRAWGLGPLRWSEFRDLPAMSVSPSYLASDIELSTAPASNAAVFTIEAQAVMYPERSYANPADTTEQLLRYLQARFDLQEVMSRRLRAELAKGINGLEADRRLTHYRDLYSTEAEKMERATNYGQDEQALQQWEYDIRRALEQMDVPVAATVEPSPWSYGLFAGIGGLFPTGSISDAFSGGCVFTFGLTGGWKRLRVHGSIGYTTPTVRDVYLVNPEYAGQDFRANVNNANLLDIGFGVGFNVLDTKHFSMEPYVGGHWTGYNWTARPMVENDEGGFTTTGLQHRMQVDDFNLAFGMNFEWHFHSAVADIPLFGSMREQYVSSLRLTPYAMRACYTDAVRHLSGWQIGFMVSYSGLARALRFR